MQIARDWRTVLTRLNNGLRILFEASKPGGEAIKGDAAALRDARQRVATASRQLKDMEQQIRSTNLYLGRCIAELQSDAHEGGILEGENGVDSVSVEEAAGGEMMLLGTLQSLLGASGSKVPVEKERLLREAKASYLSLLDQLQHTHQSLMEHGDGLRATLWKESSNWMVGEGDSKWVAYHEDYTWALCQLERGLTATSSFLQLKGVLKRWSASSSLALSAAVRVVALPPNAARHFKARIRFRDLAEALDQMTRE